MTTEIRDRLARTIVNVHSSICHVGRKNLEVLTDGHPEIAENWTDADLYRYAESILHPEEYAALGRCYIGRLDRGGIARSIVYYGLKASDLAAGEWVKLLGEYVKPHEWTDEALMAKCREITAKEADEAWAEMVAPEA